MSGPAPGQRHIGPPPGYVNVEEAIRLLGRSRGTVYDRGLLDILDSWQAGPRTQRLFRRGDVATVVNWMWARRGMVAMGLWTKDAPLFPERGFKAISMWFSDAEYLCDCPICDGRALYNPADPNGPTWCEEHGLVNPADYPPTPRMRELMALYGEDWAEDEEEQDDQVE